MVSSSSLQLYDGDFAGGLLLVNPLESWLELHLDLVFALRKVSVPLVALLDGCRCAPPGGVGSWFQEDALAVHIVLCEVKVGAVDWAGCQEVRHAPRGPAVESTACEGVFVSGYEGEGHVWGVGVIWVVYGE